MRLLVVEDDKRVSSFVRRSLAAEGFIVDVAQDGREGFHLALDQSYDLIVLDVLLPHLDGLEVLAEIRRHGCQAPVLILSARDAVQDRIRGLNTGADDYLVKPFEFEELTARVRALLRRSTQVDDEVLQIADLHMDGATRKVTRGDRRLDLTPREYALLEYLLRNKGNVVTRTMIAEHVWDQHFDSFSNVIDVYIRYLRRKVDADAPVKLIHTLRGIGYVLAETFP